jgi:hypothetical protein
LPYIPPPKGAVDLIDAAISLPVQRVLCTICG